MRFAKSLRFEGRSRVYPLLQSGIAARTIICWLHACAMKKKISLGC